MACPSTWNTLHPSSAVLSASLSAPFHVVVQCMGPAILGDTLETEPVLLMDQPTLPLQTPLGLSYWSAICASWDMRNLVKVNPPPPPSGGLFLSMWPHALKLRAQHPMATLPNEEVRLLHTADKGQLQHPRVQGAGNPPPPPPKTTVLAQTEKAEKRVVQKNSSQNEALIDQYGQAGGGGGLFTRTDPWMSTRWWGA